MFESYVVYYLNQYLGRYVDGIDQKSLRISIYKGDVVLRNLRLRPDALASLDLPVTVRAGLLGSLTLKVPWSSLGTVPVEVKVDRLFLLASPKTEEERNRGVRREDGIEPAFQLAKRQRVSAQEERWVEELQAASEQEEKMRAAGGAAAPEAGGGVGGMLKAVIDTVIGNLQLSITNVHIRYEDAYTNPGHPFACGLTLDALTGYTVDELGKEAFITNNPLAMLRKALRLRRMAFYFDTDAEFWMPGGAGSWVKLAPADWDTWFMPGIGADALERGGTARHRQYVLQPVDGQALYMRRGAGEKHKDEEPVMEVDFTLDCVAVRLSQPQYQSYHLLLSEVSSFSARLAHSAYRPRLRPAAGEQARLWWRYAVKAVQQQVLARKLTWSQAVKFAGMRKEYVSLYSEHLRSPIDPARPRDRLPKGIVDMDRELPEQTIVMFRRLAYLKLQREKRKAAAEAAAAGKGAGAGGWLSWLAGGGGGAKESRPAGAGQEGEAAPELSKEEYDRLLQLVTDQEQGLRLGTQTPFTLLTRIKARVGSASAILVAADGTRVLRGGLEGIHLGISRYPETLRVELGVTAMGVESPEGTFIQTGAQLQRVRSATDLSEELEIGGEAAGCQALAVQFTQKPQDGSADAVLDIVLTPSYVYYSASAVDRVVAFFKTPEQLDFSNLSAQATTQLERARRLAAQYAAAALQNRPKLRLHLVLDAPKVAIPAVDASGRATLALDFGRFIVESDFQAAEKLPAEEAALYECVRLRVADVAAYVADGEFDWQQQDKSGPLVPLLERTAMDIALQAARFADPRYPALRLQPSIPVLHFYLSPGRMGRMLRVIRAALPAGGDGGAAGGGSAGGAQAGAGGAAQQELWRQHAEYEGPVRVLTWSGLGRTVVTWCPRHGILYQGKLYLYEGPQPGAKLAATESVWTERRAIRVPPDKMGGVEHVVALCPESLDLTRLAESTSSLVLRLDSEEQADAWLRHLQQTRQAMLSLAGETGALLPPDWEEASSTVSGTEADEAAAAGGLTAAHGVPPGARAAEAGQVPAVVFQIDAELGELAIFGGGRQPDPWWPPDEVDGQPRSGGGTPAGTPRAPPLPDDGFVSVDGEVPLIVMRAAGGTCHFTYGAEGMTVHTALGSLEIEDLLVGQRCPKNRFLASSRMGAEPIGEDVFFDAEERLASVGSTSSAGSTPRGGLSPASPSPLGPACQALSPSQDLAEFVFKLRQPGTPSYEGVDTSLDVTLSSLYFFCNRPTVAALITMGIDIGAAASTAFGGSDAASAGADTGAGSAGVGGGGEQEACQAEGEPEAAGAAGAAAAAAAGAAVAGAGVEDTVDQVRLLGGGTGDAGERSTFRFTASLGTLQAVLNYEGGGCHALSQASVDAFSFSLDIKPDTSLRITTTLGNVQALDCTLPEGHPYHQACGLREGSTNSLVSLEFCSLPPCYRHPAVPEGLQYYTLQAQLSELQLVFLYRFLQENLTYISTMLAMRLPPLEGAQDAQATPVAPEAAAAHAAPASPGSPRGAAAAAAPEEQGGGGGGGGVAEAVNQAAAPAAAPLQPFVLLLDVQASAPNICLPRSSDSLDSIEVDLGSLTLKTQRVVAQSPLPAAGSGAFPLLVEDVDLCFSGVGCTVVQGSKRGSNVMRNAESGWRLHWRRPLQAVLRGDQPMFDLSLDVPFLKAAVSDTEYQLMTSVASDNFAEDPQLPAGASWLNDHYQAILLQQQEAALAAAQAAQESAEAAAAEQQGATGDEAAAGALARSSLQRGDQAEGGATPAKKDKSRTSVRVAVSIGEIELELRRGLEGAAAPQPLARFTLADLWVAYRNTEQGSMFVSVCVPRVEARDLRPEVPPELSLAISSGHKASFLMLEWAAAPGMAHQALALTLQKPTLVAELSFLLAVTQFVVPTFAFVKNRPIPFVTHDVALGAEPHAADGDLFLCPTVRLLADSPASCAFEYDGQGHRLVLPDKEHLDEQLPLILVGAGRTLRLRNLRLVNSASLAVCLQLAPGARLLASPDDGVELKDYLADDPELARQLSATSGPPSLAGTVLLNRTLSPQRRGTLEMAGAPGAGGGELSSPRRSARQPTTPLSPARSSGAAHIFSPAASQPMALAAAQQQQQRSTIEVLLSAVGVGLQFVHLDGAAAHGGSRPGSSAGSRPGSVAGSWQDSAVHSRQGSGIDLEVAASQALAAGASSGALAGGRRATQAQGAQAQPGAARAVQMLAANFDLELSYRLQDLEQSGRVAVQGLRVETRYIQDMAARMAQRDQQDARHKRKLRGQREASVLDPCRLKLDFKLVAAGGEGEGATPSSADVRLEASDLRLTLSPDVLELGGLLAASALEPLMQPQPDQPLASCNQFERVWSYDPAGLFSSQPGGAPAVSLAVTGAEGGVTVWRAKTPTGYAVAGDVVTPGASQPTFEVMAVAVNSGLAAYPTSYTRVWAGGGAAIWRPVAPQGYVSVGDLFSADGAEPELSAMVCLHVGTLVDSSPGERLTLPPQLAHAPAVTATAAAAVPRVDLWCLDNSMGTFFAGTQQLPPPEQNFDLRNPLGVTPAALLAIGAAAEVVWAAPPRQPDRDGARPQDVQQPPAAAAGQQRQLGGVAKQQAPAEMFRQFEHSRRELRAETVARLVTPSVVDFRRICAVEADEGGGSGMSIWRPVPPPGYAALGDCLARGLDPPPAASVIQDTGAEEGFGHGSGLPLVKAPRGFEPVWEDVSVAPNLRLVIWKPMPYPGYVAMGCVAGISTDPPPRSCVKCLRADAAARGSPGRSPTWAVRATNERGAAMPPLTAWTVDEKLHTFVVSPLPPEKAEPPLHSWRLRQPASEQAEVPAAQQAAGGVNVVIKGGQAAVQLQDAFHVPLLELSLGAVEAGVRGPSRSVVQAYLGFKLGVWSYNRAVRDWEPVLEPWDVIAQCAANYGTRMANGIDPGVAVSVKSSSDCVRATLAFSALHSILTAYSDWQQLHGHGGDGGRALRALAAAGGGAAMHVLVDNRLGVEAAMELDHGDSLQLVKLPLGSATPIVKPLPSFPLRQGEVALTVDALPHNLLLIDIQQAMRSASSSDDTPSGQGERAPGGAAEGSGEQRGQLYCRVRLEAGGGTPRGGPSSPGGSSTGRLSSAPSFKGWSSEGGTPARTRALPLAAGGVVAWHERLILPLPMLPASTDETLVFEVWDAAAGGGRGACLGSTTLPVPVRSLRHREEHDAEVCFGVPSGSGNSGRASASGQQVGSGGGVASGDKQQLRLQLSYMLQKQWSHGLMTGSAQPAPHAWHAEASTAGQRALSLNSQAGCWAVIPAFGQQKAAGGAGGKAGGGAGASAGSASVIPLRVGKESVVVESSVVHGSRREVLRALCQLVNTTGLTLEACLVEVEDSEWQHVASRSGSVSAAVSADSVEEEVFENERFARNASGAQWGAANLRSREDPRRFQYALQQADSFPQVDPPRGWEWESAWELEHGPSTGGDGWAYGPDFKSLHFPPPAGADKPGLNDFVRRRRWVRRRRRTGGDPSQRISMADALGGQQPRAGTVATHRQALGCAAPGEALPLPLGWSTPGRQLQLRPVLPAAPAAGDAAQQQGEQQGGGEEGLQGLPSAEVSHEGAEQQLQALHDWSRGSSEGQHTLKLDSLDETITRLVCCPSLHSRAMGSAGSELDVADLWFSVTVEGDTLAGSKAAGAMTDWRVVVSAPLRLTNHLPVPGSLLVWEQQPGATRELVGRQTVQVACGATVPIHTVNMRRVVSFSFYPEGYEWAEPAPTVLSEGLQGRGRGRPALPGRFRLVRPGSSIPLEVFIQRSIDWGAWVLEAREELDPGSVVANGVPMSVSLLSPLWIVNATSLAVDAVIVPLDAPPPSHSKTQTASAMLKGKRAPASVPAAEGLQRDTVHVVDTDDRNPEQRGDFRGRRFVAPSSLELLSYPLPSLLAQSASQQQLPTGAGSSSGAGASDQHAAVQRRRYGVRLRVAGSGWTPPLALDMGEVASGGSQQQADGGSGLMQSSRPLLIRALTNETGMVHEVVARLEVSAQGSAQVLRLEPHVVISNRTAVSLQLLQSRLQLADAPAAFARPVGAVVAEGGASFTQASRGLNAALMSAGGPPLVRPARSSLTAASLMSGGEESFGSVASTLSGASSQWDRAPSLMPSGASPLVQMNAASFRQQVQRNAVLDLAAGAASMPLPLSAGLLNHTLSFRCVPPPAYAAAAAADSLPLWSRPVTIKPDAEGQLFVVVPVIPAEEEGQGGDGGDGGTGDAAHLTASGGSASTAGWPPAVAILRLSVHRRGPGAVHVVLESMQSDPPYLLENRTLLPLQYRQAHVRGAPLHTLEPLSAAGYVWEFSMAGAPHNLELQETAGKGQTYALDAPDEQDGEPASGGARAPPLALSAYPHQCSIKVSYFEQVTMGPAGVTRIGGEGSGVLGRGGIDRVLQVAPGHEPLLTASAKALAPAKPDLSVAFELPGLEVSLVDHTPRELLLLSAAGLKAAAVLGSNPASSYKSVRLSVQRLQLDNMLPATPFPVVLAPALQQPPGAGGQPVLAVTLTSVLGGARGRSYMPLVAVRWPVTLQLAISEALVWSCHQLVLRLQADLEGVAEAGGGATVAASDVPVRIRLLSVDGLRTEISFQGDPLSRPRDLAGGLIGQVIDMASFQAAPVSLQGLNEENLTMLQSALSANIAQHYRSQLFGVTLSLVRSFGLAGGTARALGAISAAVAKLADHGDPKAKARAKEAEKQKRSVTDVGDGMLEGVGAIGSSFLRGFRGLVEKPLQGAKQAGIEGAAKGVAKGIVGVFANPVSGFLEAMSATAEGVEATFGKPKDRLLVAERRRPPRVVSGEGKLLPLMRNGSTKQSSIEQIGQALLRNTLLTQPDALRRLRQGGAVEAYEEHFVLPEDRVLLLTSAGVLLVHAPGFAQLDGAAEIGAITVSDVAPGRVQWSVGWDDLLCFELLWGRGGGHNPDRLIVHRKGTPGWMEQESLAHQVKCFEGTPQASQIKLVAQKVHRKYYLDPLRSNQQWSRRHEAASLPAGTPLEQLPLTMPCMDFQLTWHTNPRKQPVVSFWRPQAPAGYRAVGDVLALGLEPPTAPVPCFRDDVGLRLSSAAAAAAVGAGRQAPGGEPPAAMPPREFSLIWRYNGKRPVTVWMPVAPPGYAALGAIVRGEPEVPPAEEYLCVRSDLTETARVFNSPIWSYDPVPALAAAAQSALRGGMASSPPLPHHPEGWKVSVWQVDNRLGTFIAVRANSPPPPDVPRTVRSIEERAGKLGLSAAARRIPA